MNAIDQNCGLVLPENERLGRRYEDEDRLGARPRREQQREAIAEYVMMKLGAPVIDVELDVQQLTLAVDEALRVFEDHAPASYYDYYYFQTTPGKSKYKMPPDIGLIRQVYYKTGMSTCGASAGWLGGDSYGWLEGAIPIAHSLDIGYSSGMYMGHTPGAPIYGRAGDFVLMTGYNEMYQRLASLNGGWEWAPENHIILFPNPRGVEWVIVHCLQRKKDWATVSDWVQRYALNEAKEMLGRIRSKYGQVPGPDGPLTLDGASLIQEAREDRVTLMDELYTKYGADHMFMITG